MSRRTLPLTAVLLMGLSGRELSTVVSLLKFRIDYKERETRELPSFALQRLSSIIGNEAFGATLRNLCRMHIIFCFDESNLPKSGDLSDANFQQIEELFEQKIKENGDFAGEKPNFYFRHNKSVYVFNYNWQLWRPVESSPAIRYINKIKRSQKLQENPTFEEITSQINLNFDQYRYSNIDIKRKLEKVKRINGGSLLKLFLDEYEAFYETKYVLSGRGAVEGRILKNLLNVFRDGKKEDTEAEYFIKWVFEKKAPKSKAPIQVEFLRSFLNEYFIETQQSKTTYIDEMGHIRRK